jgi:hypothetical protein
MMASNNSVVSCPTTTNPEFLVEVKSYLEGLCEIERKPIITGLCVEVMAEDGSVQVCTVPHVAGTHRGVDVDELAKRLGTDVDCVHVL